MPFGISSASEVFQDGCISLQKGLSGVKIKHNNFIIVYCGKT